MKSPLWNTVLPSKTYVILDDSWFVLGEVKSDSASEAMKDAKVEYGRFARVAILKSMYDQERKQSEWLRKARAAT